MGSRAVVALEVVLGSNLPVAVELGLGALEEAERLEIDSRVCDQLGDAVEIVLERISVRVRVYEEQRPPGGKPERDEAELLLRDAAFSVSARRRDQAAVQPVGPGVVGALERLAPTRALADEGAAVPTDVQERAKLVL